MLRLFDKNQELLDLDEKLRAVKNGTKGGAVDVLMYLRNDDLSVYYRDLLITLEEVGGFEGYLSEDGFYIKFLAGSSEPSEAEWDLVLPGESLPLEDIGNYEEADTYTYHPIWVRVYIPGKTPSQHKEFGTIKIYYTEYKVTG